MKRVKKNAHSQHGRYFFFLLLFFVKTLCHGLFTCEKNGYLLVYTLYIRTECNTFYTWLKQENWLAPPFSRKRERKKKHKRPNGKRRSNNIITSRHIVALSRAVHERA